MAGVHPAARRFEGERQAVVAAYAQGLADAGSPPPQPRRRPLVRRGAVHSTLWAAPRRAGQVGRRAH